jgi:hypothetical protein
MMQGPSTIDEFMDKLGEQLGHVILRSDFSRKSTAIHFSEDLSLPYSKHLEHGLASPKLLGVSREKPNSGQVRVTALK